MKIQDIPILKEYYQIVDIQFDNKVLGPKKKNKYVDYTHNNIKQLRIYESKHEYRKLTEDEMNSLLAYIKQKMERPENALLFYQNKKETYNPILLQYFDDFGNQKEIKEKISEKEYKKYYQNLINAEKEKLSALQRLYDDFETYMKKHKRNITQIVVTEELLKDKKEGMSLRGLEEKYKISRYLLKKFL